MVGPMYLEEDFPEFETTGNGYELSPGEDVRFCSQLVYDGFDDWFLPTIDQILNYLHENPDEFIIPNLSPNPNSTAFRLGIDPYTSAIFWQVSVQGSLNEIAPNKISSISTSSGGAHRCFCVRNN